MSEPDTDINNIVLMILDRAKSAGATQAEAEVSMGSGLSVTARMRDVEKIEHERDKGLSLTVYLGKRKGSASTTDFSEKAIQDTVDAACVIARNASEDPFAGLIEPEYLAQEIPDLDLYHAWDITPETAADMAVSCESEALDFAEPLKNSDGVLVSSYTGEHVYGNTHDFVGGWKWSSHMVDCTVIAEQNGKMQRDGWYSKARDNKDMQDYLLIGQEAAKRTIARLGARKIPTCNGPVIFEAPVASSLFSAFIGAISGGSLYRKASFLLDKLEHQVFASHVQIQEQPYIMKGMGSAPFDNDGMTTKQRDIVKDGILKSYVLSGYSARKLGLTPTGNAGGVHNLIIEPGKETLDDMIKVMNRGLLVTDLIGFGVNQVTGDYSRGASGFWVDNGEIQYPVEEITIAGNLNDIYQQILAIGSDVDLRKNIRTGSVLIENMTIAGQ